MYRKLYLVDRLLVYVQYFSIRYLMCAVMTNYIAYCMHALTVTSRPKLYIFNVTFNSSVTVSQFMQFRNQSKCQIRGPPYVQQLLQFSSSTFRFFASPYLLNDSLMSRPDLSLYLSVSETSSKRVSVNVTVDAVVGLPGCLLPVTTVDITAVQTRQ